MKLTMAIVVALLVTGAAPVGDAPDCRLELALPGTGHTLSLAWRQVGPSLTDFRESEGMSARALKQLQVKALLAFGGALETSVAIRVGDQLLTPGRYRMGLTVGAGGGMHFFLVDGTQTHPIAFEPVESGHEAPRLLMSLAYVDSHQVFLGWQHAGAAGRVRIAVGSAQQPRKEGGSVPAQEGGDDPSGDGAGAGDAPGDAGEEPRGR